MIEDTDTLSELSRTIDDLNHNKGNLGSTTFNFNTHSAIRFAQIDETFNKPSMIEDHTQLSIIAPEQPSMEKELVESPMKMLDTASIGDKSRDDIIGDAPDKSLNQSGFEMLSPKMGLRRSRAHSEED